MSANLSTIFRNFRIHGSFLESRPHGNGHINDTLVAAFIPPGLAHYDFGDMVRTATSPAAEDETDRSRVRMQMPMFEALVQGYLSTAGGFLNDAEKSNLAFSGKLIALEIGIRFLTDHLEGDVYFKTRRPNHNLDRCRTQLALVKSIEEQEEAMNDFVRMAAQ